MNIAGDWQACNPYTRTVLRDIFCVIRDLHAKFGVGVYVQWCRLGIWHGNERADAQAKAVVEARTTSIPRLPEYRTWRDQDSCETAAAPTTHRPLRTRADHRMSSLRNFFKWDLVRDGCLRSKQKSSMLSASAGRPHSVANCHSRCNFSQYMLMHYRHSRMQWRHTTRKRSLETVLLQKSQTDPNLSSASPQAVETYHDISFRLVSNYRT